MTVSSVTLLPEAVAEINRLPGHVRQRVRIARAVGEHPDWNNWQIAREVGCTVRHIAKPIQWSYTVEKLEQKLGTY